MRVEPRSKLVSASYWGYRGGTPLLQNSAVVHQLLLHEGRSCQYVYMHLNNQACSFCSATISADFSCSAEKLDFCKMGDWVQTFDSLSQMCLDNVDHFATYVCIIMRFSGLSICMTEGSGKVSQRTGTNVHTHTHTYSVILLWPSSLFCLSFFMFSF